MNQIYAVINSFSIYIQVSVPQSVSVRSILLAKRLTGFRRGPRDSRGTFKFFLRTATSKIQ